VNDFRTASVVGEEPRIFAMSDDGADEQAQGEQRRGDDEADQEQRPRLTTQDVNAMRKAQMQAELRRRGIGFGKNDTKSMLEEKLLAAIRDPEGGQGGDGGRGSDDEERQEANRVPVSSVMKARIRRRWREMVDGCGDAADRAAVLSNLDAVQLASVLLALWKMAGNDSQFMPHRLDFRGPVMQATYEDHLRVVGEIGTTGSLRAAVETNLDMYGALCASADIKRILRNLNQAFDAVIEDELDVQWAQLKLVAKGLSRINRKQAESKQVEAEAAAEAKRSSGEKAEKRRKAGKQRGVKDMRDRSLAVNGGDKCSNPDCGYDALSDNDFCGSECELEVDALLSRATQQPVGKRRRVAAGDGNGVDDDAVSVVSMFNALASEETDTTSMSQWQLAKQLKGRDGPVKWFGDDGIIKNARAAVLGHKEITAEDKLAYTTKEGHIETDVQKRYDALLLAAGDMKGEINERFLELFKDKVRKLHGEKTRFMTVHGVLYDVMASDYSDHLKRKLKSTMKQAPATGDGTLAQQVKGLQKRLDRQQQWGSGGNGGGGKGAGKGAGKGGGGKGDKPRFIDENYRLKQGQKAGHFTTRGQRVANEGDTNLRGRCFSCGSAGHPVVDCTANDAERRAWSMDGVAAT
jgi:hypothetical protein